MSVLTLLFNAIILSSHIPHAFRNGLVIPIPKSSTKDLSDPANYRGITILSNISKVLEKLVLLRISELDPPPTLNPLQGGFRAGYSCSHMAFLLQEAIIETRSSGGKAFVAFLDVRKAFDTVWHEGLLVKLMNKGIKGHLWHLINSWYTASSGCVLWNGQRSQPFTLLQGVRQGGVLSPFLYCLYVDELLDQLSASKIGASISDIYCGAPMYADDLALVAGSQGALQSLLDMVDRYARKWRYSLNSSKSVIMVFGEATRTRERERCQREFRLGEEEVLEVDEQHHLGILRSVSSSTIARTNGRAAACRSAFYSFNSVGSRFGSLHPLTSLKLYRAVCLPILLYGSELSTLTKTELQIFERLHRKILRTIQGLPTRCPSSALLAMVGMQSVEDLIKQRKLGFILSIVNHPPDSLPRRVLEVRSGSDCANSIVANFNVVLSELNLPDLSHLLMAQPSAPLWKRHTKNHLAIKGLLQHIEDCADYHASACEFRPLKPARHWTTTVGDPALTRLNNFRIRLLVGCDGLEKDAARFRSRNTGRPAGDPTCKLCGADSEDAVHFIFSCQALSVRRRGLLSGAPPIISSTFTDSTSSSNPQTFADVILGTCWINDPEVQSFCIKFLSGLKEARAALLLSV